MVAVTAAWVHVEPPEDYTPVGECPLCGFDSVVAFPVYLMTPLSVLRLPDDVWACIRCLTAVEVDDTPDCA